MQYYISLPSKMFNTKCSITYLRLLQLSIRSSVFYSTSSIICRKDFSITSLIFSHCSIRSAAYIYFRLTKLAVPSVLLLPSVIHNEELRENYHSKLSLNYNFAHHQEITYRYYNYISFFVYTRVVSIMIHNYPIVHTLNCGGEGYLILIITLTRCDG